VLRKKNETKKSDIIAMIQSRRRICAGYVACTVEMIHAYIILVGKPLGKSKLGHREIRCELVDWTNLIQDRVQCRAFEITAMSLRVS
jgi:hypothetical protein